MFKLLVEFCFEVVRLNVFSVLKRSVEKILQIELVIL